ncbi:hypothetical protein LTR37_008770 [Vermiconidia calcicola]|uniref:Uncharacterized protein n=1 Tax=Vermiconidia calcicola TaxID=1690605 RepID=A0ACC3N9W2_9PEZI|nr:hypothetical protein LTR37_008770 [Vermiconidia calcicola]
MRSLVTALPFAAAVVAEWSGNINYGSPSHLHKNLGLSMPKVLKRQAGPAYMDAGMLNFTHGVASGDPYPKSVILWTRAAPMMDNDRSNVTVEGTVPLYNHDTKEYVRASTNPVCVSYVVATDSELSDVVTSGKAYTSSDIDYTVKVEAKGLEPFTQYYYQFSICGSNNQSPLGRTKTAPRHDDDLTSVGIAVFSCSNFPAGFFNSYGNAARKDNVDYVVHLGDYIYEYNTTGPIRHVEPEVEIFTLYDYRRRLATYRTDEDLLLSHSKFAWIPVWDDHEVSDNSWRGGSSGLNNTEESFQEFGGVSLDQRKMNAVRAYFEWMRAQVDMDDNLRIWRSFSIGSLFDLIMLDTRHYDRSITTLGWNDEYVAELSNDAGRTLMGSRQENWFYDSLIESAQRGATWRIIGNQIIFSRVDLTSSWGTPEVPLNFDAWDGYMANKNRTLKTLYDNDISNNIFLAGDSHANWVSDLVWLDEKNYNPETGEGALGAEFGGTAVSSTGPCDEDDSIAKCNADTQKVVNDNEELQWNEGWYRGYFEMKITPERLIAHFFGTPSLQTRNGYEISLANFTVEAGANRLSRPIAGGAVEDGALQNGEVTMSKLTYDTNTGEYFVHNFSRVTIEVDY